MNPRRVHFSRQGFGRQKGIFALRFRRFRENEVKNGGSIKHPAAYIYTGCARPNESAVRTTYFILNLRVSQMTLLIRSVNMKCLILVATGSSVSFICMVNPINEPP